MNRTLIIVCLMMFMPLGALAQTVGVKTNLLYLATTTPNLAFEIGLGNKFSLNLMGAYNPFEFSSSEKGKQKMSHFLGTLEGRYWFCQKFDGTFIGLQGIYTDYDVEDVPLIRKPRNHRYDGNGYGAGAVFGYHWAVGSRWGLELSAGAGVVFLKYTKYDRGEDAEAIGDFKTTYFGPTKLNLSFMYFF